MGLEKDGEKHLIRANRTLSVYMYIDKVKKIVDTESL